MKLIRMNISVPSDIKAKLDALRAHGTTASGFIRSVLVRELKNASEAERTVSEEQNKGVLRYRRGLPGWDRPIRVLFLDES